MSLLVVGLSHHTAPVPVLERATIDSEHVGKVLDELHRSDSISEVVVLSTCNRIEIYADVARFHPAVTDVTTVLARLSGMRVTDLGEHLYVHFAEAAAEHLFRMVSGLDSMVIGEAQILGQYREAYGTATNAGTVGRVLHEASQVALRVGKRVHSETLIDRAGASVVAVALRQAVDYFGGDPSRLASLRTVVVGAGSMGALAVASLTRLCGTPNVTVVNRSLAHAQRLADTVAGRAATLDALADEVATADLLIACTGATGTVIDVGVLEARAPRPLVILDLAMPRDVDVAAAGLPYIHYVDLDVLSHSGAMVTADEVSAAEAILVAELRGFLAAQQALAVAPTVSALRARAAQVVDAELLRLDGRLPGLDPSVREEVSDAVRRAVDKVLHAPTVRVKELAATPEGDAYAAALRELFDLDPAGPGSVTAVRTEPGQVQP